jgi:hypothetical protein
MANMNNTYEYWDSLNGNALVCSAFGPSGYHPWCVYSQFILGGWFSFVGIGFLYNARRLQRLVAKAGTGKGANARERCFMLYFTRLTLVFGVEFFAWGCAHAFCGHGTANAATSTLGLTGEFAFAVVTACTVYQCLHQLRGAEAFRNLVQLNEEQTKSRAYISAGLDFVQGTGIFPIALVLWFLLAFEVITRPEYYGTCYMLMCASGIRSLIENILDRMRTLVQVNTLQQGAAGDFSAKQRRRDVLKKKARQLIVDMMMIFVINVLIPVLVIVSGAVNSSSQWLIQSSVINTLAIIPMTSLLHRTQGQVTKKNKKFAKVNGDVETDMAMSSASQFTVANESGLSVVGESEVGKLRSPSGKSGHEPGLFSDVETDA